MPEAVPTLKLERQLHEEGFRSIAGIDEAGRGCLAGPVVASAVILPPGEGPPALEEVADSKALPRERREALAENIRAEAAAVGVGACSPTEIDELNILGAAMEAMRRAAEALPVTADFLLIDGNRAPGDAPRPLTTVVKGDQKSRSIAAASIIAKTTRDALMRRLHEMHPPYGWDTNVGYPTAAHYDALDTHGPTEHHRRSFRLSRRRED